MRQNSIPQQKVRAIITQDNHATVVLLLPQACRRRHYATTNASAGSVCAGSGA